MYMCRKILEKRAIYWVRIFWRSTARLLCKPIDVKCVKTSSPLRHEREVLAKYLFVLGLLSSE